LFLSGIRHDVAHIELTLKQMVFPENYMVPELEQLFWAQNYVAPEAAQIV
jgi:hypothetical protein